MTNKPLPEAKEAAPQGKCPKCFGSGMLSVNGFGGEEFDTCWMCKGSGASKEVRAAEESSKWLQFLRHMEGCGGYRADSLSKASWLRTAHKWRDCTCGLAELMQGELAEAAPKEAPFAIRESRIEAEAPGQPCGHSSQYCYDYTNSGGRKMICLLCEFLRTPEAEAPGQPKMLNAETHANFMQKMDELEVESSAGTGAREQQDHFSQEWADAKRKKTGYKKDPRFLDDAK